MQRIEKTVIINAPRADVWDALTNASSIPQWMGAPELRIEVSSTWTVGQPLVITGVLHGTFENAGTILRFEPEHVLCYTHLSSLSRLPDEPQNYCRLCFEVAEAASGTAVTLTVTNFPTETIFKHMDFYWRTAIEVFKRFVEHHHAIADG